ncbi:hydantoinase/oxoprolinase family protein [Methylomarinum sp. Ch1-1]|uniref:Hydantoinase/oxoprolinase family protein n=1 Tax=Methylomarinum roseum TaxID=3067653 RepID=A0AAU7NRP1_9GAMM|nr:hydantoinase/oxoprolinase family protein [Methylomarinum sp. Ch1-1]MDP4520355.1 hydantoinase/oxoprolinase family protein [Methylomarinum sp. Ch1-1]
MQQHIIGWDIGGAHVKAALLDGEGSVVDVLLLPCPLWQGMAYLAEAVQTVLAHFSEPDCRHALTMTGELVDLFDSREQGVRRIIEAMLDYLQGKELAVYAGRRGFLSPANLSEQDCLDIASMNWLASASLAARTIDAGLFVDIGSTTTDVLLLERGSVSAIGLTDYQRLVSAELVYTGIVRTAVMAVAQQALFNGQNMGLMAEYFATMADVYRITGELNEDHDLSDTADGGAKTAEASARRLSRMTGYEFESKDWPIWLEFARQIKAVQKQQIAAACRRQMQRTTPGDDFCFVGAGIGRFLVQEIAEQLGASYLDFNQLTKQDQSKAGIDSADCAPAVAVASLAAEFC